MSEPRHFHPKKRQRWLLTCVLHTLTVRAGRAIFFVPVSLYLEPCPVAGACLGGGSGGDGPAR